MCSLSSSTDDTEDRDEMEDEVYDLLQSPPYKHVPQIGARGGPTIGPSNFDHLHEDSDSDHRERHRVSIRDGKRGLGDHPTSLAREGCDLNLPEHHHSDVYLGFCHGTTDQFSWHMEPCGHVVTEHRGLGTIMFGGERFPQEGVPLPKGDCGHDTWDIAVVRAELGPNQLAYLGAIGKLDHSLRAELSLSQRACLAAIGKLYQSSDRRHGCPSRQACIPQTDRGKNSGQWLLEERGECRNPYTGRSRDDAVED